MAKGIRNSLKELRYSSLPFTLIDYVGLSKDPLKIHDRPQVLRFAFFSHARKHRFSLPPKHGWTLRSTTAKWLFPALKSYAAIGIGMEVASPCTSGTTLPSIPDPTSKRRAWRQLGWSCCLRRPKEFWFVVATAHRRTTPSSIRWNSLSLKLAMASSSTS